MATCPQLAQLVGLFPVRSANAVIRTAAQNKTWSTWSHQQYTFKILSQAWTPFSAEAVHPNRSLELGFILLTESLSVGVRCFTAVQTSCPPNEEPVEIHFSGLILGGITEWLRKGFQRQMVLSRESWFSLFLVSPPSGCPV